MYGLKSPRYMATVGKGTVTKRTVPKSQVGCQISHYATISGAKLYIAKSISDEVTHGIVGCMENMTHDIVKSTRLGRIRNGKE